MKQPSEVEGTTARGRTSDPKRTEPACGRVFGSCVLSSAVRKYLTQNLRRLIFGANEPERAVSFVCCSAKNCCYVTTDSETPSGDSEQGGCAVERSISCYVTTDRRGRRPARSSDAKAERPEAARTVEVGGSGGNGRRLPAAAARRPPVKRDCGAGSERSPSCGWRGVAEQMDATEGASHR